ncbi:MAG: hypothetical protein HY671_00070 [Chloroflexi bacterium]|nr:hypothetical protein [Chloroflexota bacterium]
MNAVARGGDDTVLSRARPSSPKASGREKLAAALHRLISARGTPTARIDLAPGCAFGVAVDERLKEVERQIGEVKERLNGLIYLVIGAVVVEVVLRLMK